VTSGIGGPVLGPQGLGCLSLHCAQWAEWQALNENSCSSQQSNKSNPIYSLPWDIAMSWKVHLWQFPGLVTFSAFSLAYSSKVQVFMKWEIKIIKEKIQTKACSWIWQESCLSEFNGSTFLCPCQRDKAVLINLIYNITYPLYEADIITSYPWAFNPNLINLASRSIVLWHSECLLRSQTILSSWVSKLFSCLHLLLICVTYNK